MISRGSGGEPADGSSYDAALNGDGRLIGYESDASNLVRAERRSNDNDVFITRWR